MYIYIYIINIYIYIGMYICIIYISMYMHVCLSRYIHGRKNQRNKFIINRLM